MHQHARHAHVRVAQRAAKPEPQLIQKATSVVSSSGSVVTTIVRNARPTSSNDDNNSDETTTRAKASAASNVALLGAPVSASAAPTTTAVSSDDKSNNSSSSSNDDGSSDRNSPSPTSTRSHASLINKSTSTAVVASSTLATSTLSTSSSKSGSTTTSASGSSATKAFSDSNTTSSGLSTGGKIGLAIGIMALIGVFALLAVFLMKKNRKKQYQEAQARAEDEKRAAEAAAAAAASQKAKANAPAPRLSLRPVSRLVPEMMGGGRQKENPNQGNMLTTFSQSNNPSINRVPVPTAGGPQARENPFTDPVNPFSDPEKTAAAGALVHSGPSSAPRGGAYQQPHYQAHELEDTRSMSSMSRPGTANGMNQPSFMNSAVAPPPAVATGPGPDQPQGNVYRILMDFKPTMEDELELRQGSHVRLLHEYDDGWALCLKLDRSQQGVVPRTCLAAKPSKPRPNPNPAFNGRQGPGPNGNASPVSRSTTPNGMVPRTTGSPAPGMPGFHSDNQASGPQRGNGAARPGPPYPLMGPGAFNQAPRPLSPNFQSQKHSEPSGPYPAGSSAPAADMSNAGEHPGMNQRQTPPPEQLRAGPGAPGAPGFAL